MPKRTALALLALDKATAEHEQQTGVPHGLRVVRAEVVGDQGKPDAAAPSSADVYVFESIGGWAGVSADDFVRDVAGLDVARIDLHLNSPGGDAMEGAAIANVLRQHKASVTVWVDGLAASAASIIAMAGDEIVMGLGSQLMVHDPWTFEIGSAADMRKTADALDSTANSMAAAYAAKAGGTTADWRAVMQDEVWYSPEEAVSAGLADRIAGDDDKNRGSGQQVVPGASSFGGWDFWDSVASADRHRPALAAAYRYAGREQAPTPPQTPAATASGSTHEERSTPVSFTDEQLATMRTKLGLAADASEDKIVASVAEVMDEFVKDESPVKAALPEGTVAVDKEMFAQLRADAAAGREAREEQRAAHREHLVQAAITDGRIAPASKAGWLKALATDPDGEANLAGLEKGLIPVAEVGHAGHDAVTDEDNLTDADLEGLAALTGLSKEALR